ncbi:hypothetical protein CR151_16575 [Vibrio cholerae]|uniref:hypothetical protein n=1 Tax=Vibrio cholerae TaxID=666 RepID=UPI000C7F47E0|nr:hypothetical protein [Vibrio cholerae]PKQ52214.1 hypothetical protein CR151_16575 [Vibrio cholerae]
MKGYIKPILIAAGLGLTLVGCKSTPKPVEPMPFSNEHSYAYNVANQTILMRNDSPLRDFTREEEAEITQAVGRSRSGGNPSLLIGGLKILTLDLTGAIDIAGGAVANIASRDHAAGATEWIIEVDATPFSSELDAQQYIIDTINAATLEALSKYGEVKLQPVGERGKLFYLNHGGVDYLMGGFQINTPKEGVLTKTDQSLEGNAGSYYTYGVKKSTIKDRLIMIPTHLIFTVESGKNIDTTEFYTGITQHLPKGFYVYTSSMPQTEYDNKIYTDYAEVLPAIYTQGKKYEFIKPE